MNRMNFNCHFPGRGFSTCYSGVSRTIFAVGACGAGIFLVHKLYKKWKFMNLRKEWNEAGKDVVVLHQFGRGRYCANLGPFALKVETYLRLAKIQYVVDTEIPFGGKTMKCPWITLNGEEIYDSEFIIEKLKVQFNVSLDDQLSQEEGAQLAAVRILVEDHLFWCIVTWRYWFDRCRSFMKSQVFPQPLAFIFPHLMVCGIKKKAVMHGIGRYSEEEVFQFSKKDCEILSLILGKKEFFGGEVPCTADCAIFGLVSQLMWNAPDSKYEDIIKGSYKNLEQYCLRMKERAFPDWDDLLVK